MKIFCKKKFPSLFVTIFVFLSINFLYSQESSWKFGNNLDAIVGQTNEPLRVVMKANGASLRSYTFTSNVGGVAFVSIARPDSSLVNPDISLKYLEEEVDGRRLIVTINGVNYKPYMPDWQLIPITKYVASEYNSCVSLFGTNGTNEYYDIVYHPAFLNTLLGIRLLQVDMALMDLQTNSQLPTYKGHVILGEGEANIATNTWGNASMAIQSILEKSKFQSWVFTDDMVDVVFSVNNGLLIFSGEPYYYFWKVDPQQQKIYNSKTEYHNNLLNEYNKLVNQYNQENSQKILNEINAINREIENSKKEILKAEPVVENAEYATSILKNRYLLLQQLNPIIYNEALTVVHYSAFFRYLRTENTEMWDTFARRVSSVHITPKIETPTKLPRYYE